MQGLLVQQEQLERGQQRQVQGRQRQGLVLVQQRVPDRSEQMH